MKHDLIGYKRIGIVGPGSRGLQNLGRQIVEQHRDLKLAVAGIYAHSRESSEIGLGYLKDLNTRYGLAEGPKAYDSYQNLVDDPKVDLVMVTTPQYAHMEPVVYAMGKKKIYCDKPIAHTLEHAQFMYNAWVKHGSKDVIVGLTRRYENAWIRAKQIVDQGWIGETKMILLRSVIPFHRYMQRWFRKSEYSGDILNEKSAHHFDVLNWFAESKAAWISGMGGRTILTARDGYPKRCIECDRECKYRRVIEGGTGADQTDISGFTEQARNTDDPLHMVDACVYSPENDVMDHAVVNVEYENGVKAQLFLNIAGPPAEDQETLEVVGDDGRLRLTRHTAELDLVYRYGRETMTVNTADNQGGTHFGADLRLITQLADFMHDRGQPQITLEEGYRATRMAARAIESVKTHTMLEY